MRVAASLRRLPTARHPLSRPRAAQMAATAAPSPAWAALEARLKETAALASIANLLGWDEMTMLPPGDAAAALCASQKSALAAVVHARETDPALGKALQELSSDSSAGLDEWQSATVRLASRDYRRASALPASLVRAKAELESRAYAAWAAARAADDFSLFAPALGETFSMAKECAALIDPSNPNPYDVLLDEYEIGMTGARVETLFATLQAGLVPLLRLIKDAGTPPPMAPDAPAPYPVAAQAALCDAVVKAVGFDVNAGRLDVSPHPFTGGTGPFDVRMTTRFKEGASLDELAEGVTGAVHEAGHALYEQGAGLAGPGSRWAPREPAPECGVGGRAWRRPPAARRPPSLLQASLPPSPASPSPVPSPWARTSRSPSSGSGAWGCRRRSASTWPRRPPPRFRTRRRSRRPLCTPRSTGSSIRASSGWKRTSCSTLCTSCCATRSRKGSSMATFQSPTSPPAGLNCRRSCWA